MKHITVEEVRDTCGVTESLIDDPAVEAKIKEVEKMISDFYNTIFTPAEIIEVATGNGSEIHFVKRNPILALRALKIDTTSITLSGNVFFNRESGKLELNSFGSPEETIFKNKTNCIITKYVHASLEEGEHSTTTTAAATAGSSVDLSISSEDNFNVNDWVEIYGMDGNREAAKITAKTTNQITVDNISYSHESGSKVVVLRVNETYKSLMRIVTGIALVARVVGQSFDDLTGYTMGEFQVQFGEPYTQWSETARQLQAEAQEIMKKLGPRPAIF